MARPTKLTPEIKEKILQVIRIGNSYSDACQYAGIHEATFYRWKQIGEAAKSGEFCEFCEDIKRAEAEGKVRLVTIISRAGEDQWQAAAWLLERRYPEEFGKREKREISGPGGGPVEIEEIRNRLIKKLDAIADRGEKD